MQKEQIITGEILETESEILKPKIESQKVESMEKLKKKLLDRDNKLKELKRETRGLLTELNEAYKELKKTQEELIIREKLSVAGGLAAGVAHEIRNSLNIIGISVQYLHNKFNPGDERREFTETIMNKVEKLNSVATDLIYFARPHTPRFKKSDIHRILDRVLSLVKFKCAVQKVRVEKNYTQNLPLVMIDVELMEQVFLNLIDNALWAMPKGGELIITTLVLPENNFIEIKVADTGCGISREDVSRIFDPFFTHRESGTGLGLSIVHRIIEEHKGFIEVENDLKKGATFKIKLPTSQKR